MENKETDNKEIETISQWDFSSTVKIGVFEHISAPEASARNMQVLVDKINELVNEVNKLRNGK